MTRSTFATLLLLLVPLLSCVALPSKQPALTSGPTPALDRRSSSPPLLARASASARTAPAQPPGLTDMPRLTAKQALRDLRLVERALTELHPGLLRYITRAAFDAELARARAAVTEGADLGTMYLLVSQLTAAVRCGHTWTNPLNQSPTVKSTVFDRADKLPVRLRLVASRFLVTASATSAISAGAELLAIDGRTVSSLIAELLPYLRADGSSDGKRLAQLSHGEGGDALDRLFPLVHPPTGGHYTLRVRAPDGFPREVVVAATTVAAREALVGAEDRARSAWAFTIDGDTGLLTLPTFAFWNSTFDWKGFLEQSFATLEARQVPYLIIDQRRNEGGDGAIVDAVLSYLIAKPARLDATRAEVAYERAPYNLVKYLDTWNYGFFDRTGKVTKGPGHNYLYTATAPTSERVVRPARHRYQGRAFVLIGPENSSAGFVLAALIKRHRAATLVGQSTGGNLRGLNGGELAWLTLPESGVAFDVPLVAWMPISPAPDAGVTPDLVVPAHFEDVAAGVDADLVATRAAIARLRAASP
jgi:C-terminal processing protease CtpA/Prc